MFLNLKPMHFDEFLKYTSKIVNVDLPATEAHSKMTPLNRISLINSIDFSKITPKRAAVMMLLYPKETQTHLALILRADYNGVHSSQIGFPGGKVEPEDIDLSCTALRETNEEIGVDRNTINVIRAFTQVYIPPSNYMVYPFMGICNSELKFQLQEEEVAGVLELPLCDFLDDALLKSKTIKTSYSDSIEVPGFRIKNHFVWGATAMMLNELKETLKMVI